MSEDILQLEGINPIREALKAHRLIEKIYIQNPLNSHRIKEIISLARNAKILIENVPKIRLDRMSETDNHQGLIAVLPAVAYKDFDTVIDEVFNKTKTPLIVMIDEVQDPHNLGAIIRSAECAGADAVFITARRSASLNAVCAKASAGAVEHIPIAKVNNLVNAIKQLQKMGIWVIGSDEKGTTCYDADLTGAVALIIGSEGTGIRRLVKETCDNIVSIPMLGKISSLNASVAAGVLLFEVLRQRRMKK